MKLNFLTKIILIWGIFWGILGEVLFFLGILGLFYRSLMLAVAVSLGLGLIWYLKKIKILQSWQRFLKKLILEIKKDWQIGLLLIIFLAFVVLNFIIALAPEVGFDALWYHLTIPKIYLASHQIGFIKGGLLYYSVMPRLAEMFYALGLSITPGGVLPKFIHFFFGLFWFFGSYILMRLFLSRKMAILGSLAIYGTFLVTWLSQTAYIDLIVAFYASIGLWGLFSFSKNPQKNIYLYLTAVFIGLTLASKLYSLILWLIIFLVLTFNKYPRKALLFAAVSLVIVFPFYLQAYLATGNPFYPLFSIKDSAIDIYLSGYRSLKDWYLFVWPKKLPGLFWEILIYRFTPFLGLGLIFFLTGAIKKVILPFIIFIAFFILWSLVPVQESRYFMVILPILALLAAFSLENLKSRAFKVLAIIILAVGLIFNFSKALIDFKETIKLVFGQTSKENYLRARLIAPSNFYDFRGKIGQQIENKKVLTVNIHNLFYADFSFQDWTFIEDKYTHRVNTQTFALDLKKEGFDFLLIGDWDIRGWSGFPQEDLDKYFKLVLKENSFSLYQILEN